MALIIVILIGVVGTIIIERQINKPSREVKRIPVRSDNLPANRRGKDYHR